MGGARSRYEVEEVYTGFWWGNLRGRDHLEDPGIDGRIILRRIFRKWDVGHGLDLSGSGYRQIALVNAVMNLRVP
jgi:hypothetical protein